VRFDGISSDFVNFFLQRLDLSGVDGITSMVHNRKENVMFFVMKGGIPSYLIKLARYPKRNALVVSEYENLLKLRHKVSNCERLNGSIPTPILLDYYRGNAFLVTDWFLGRKSLMFGFNARRCKEAIDWLIALHQGTRTNLLFGKDLLSQYVRRYSNLACDFPLPSELDALLDETFDAFKGLNVNTVPVAFTHNDFSSANILFNNGRGLYVVDWASGQEEGFLFVDAFDLALYLVNKALNDYPESLRRLCESVGTKEKNLRCNIRRYISSTGLSREEVRWLLKIFFLSKACRFYHSGMVSRTRQLIECFQAVGNIDIAFG